MKLNITRPSIIKPTIYPFLLISLFFWSLFFTTSGLAQEKHALLIGINKYQYEEVSVSQFSGMTAASGSSTAERNWGNLRGAVNDVKNIKEILVSRFGFNRDNIITLLDEEATRENILAAIEKYVINNPNPGDDVFFFYAGHGSQVPNSLSDEVNKMDESIVPTDAALGAPDIRDKELRALFNKALDREIRLTLVFDSCHSGSVTRGIPSDVTERKLEPATYDVADDSFNNLPSPEDRGALVLSSAQDFQTAKETRNSQNMITGIFTDALIRVLREVPPDEPVHNIMTRVAARVKATIADQDPVLGGLPERTEAPFFGDASAVSGKMYAGVLQVMGNSMVRLQGGRAIGLNEGAILKRSVDGKEDVVIRVTNLDQLTEAIAELVSGTLEGTGIGDLFEVVSYGVYTGPTFAAFIPQPAANHDDLLASARAAYQQASGSGLQWVTNPTASGTGVFRFVQPIGEQWVSSLAGSVTHRGGLSETMASGDQNHPVFLNLPPSASIYNEFDFVKDDVSLIRVTDDPASADYILVGIYDPDTDRILYSWVRPNLTEEDARTSIYPVRTDWIPATDQNISAELNKQINSIAKIKAWLDLEAPATGAFPYELGLRNVRTGEIITTGHLYPGESYDVVLHTAPERVPPFIQSRYVYVFNIDNTGGSMLLFPHVTQGNTGNRIPTQIHINDGLTPVINLTQGAPLTITEPFAVNNLVLLTSEQPIGNTRVFEQEAVVGNRDAVRTRAAAASPLEQLIADRNTATRNIGRAAPVNWSISRIIVTSGKK